MLFYYESLRQWKSNTSGVLRQVPRIQSQFITQKNCWSSKKSILWTDSKRTYLIIFFIEIFQGHILLLQESFQSDAFCVFRSTAIFVAKRENSSCTARLLYCTSKTTMIETFTVIFVWQINVVDILLKKYRFVWVDTKKNITYTFIFSFSAKTLQLIPSNSNGLTYWRLQNIIANKANTWEKY